MMYVPAMQMGEIQGNWLRKSPLQPHPDMPCDGCEAYAWCRRNCMKNLYLGYVKKDERYRVNVVEPICELVRFMGREIDRHDPHAWFAEAACRCAGACWTPRSMNTWRSCLRACFRSGGEAAGIVDRCRCHLPLPTPCLPLPA
jgi:hypothetical protein